ncbi:MAG TPA: hypothetical protein PK240_06785, partial [Comamonas denitrificans]|nr:hypothetical protein [Comamonas denitrificans]
GRGHARQPNARNHQHRHYKRCQYRNKTVRNSPAIPQRRHGLQPQQKRKRQLCNANAQSIEAYKALLSFISFFK